MILFSFNKGKFTKRRTNNNSVDKVRWKRDCSGSELYKILKHLNVCRGQPVFIANLNTSLTLKLSIKKPMENHRYKSALWAKSNRR